MAQLRSLASLVAAETAPLLVGDAAHLDGSAPRRGVLETSASAPVPMTQPKRAISQARVLGTCRLCLETDTESSCDPRNPLISPCHCSGSSRHVHRACLRAWRELQHRPDAWWQCDVCLYRYRFVRAWWADLLGSELALAVAFILAMAAAVALLGCLPLTDGIFAAAARHAAAQTDGVGGLSGTAGVADDSWALAPASGAYAGQYSNAAPPLSSSVPRPLGRLGNWEHANAVAARAYVNAPPWLVLHTINGLVALALLGLLMAVVLRLARAVGLPALVLLPPWASGPCAAVMPCADVSSMLADGGNCCCAAGGIDGGTSCACAAASGPPAECGLALLALISAGAMLAGMLAAAQGVYALLLLGTRWGLAHAQVMVENVQPVLADPGQTKACCVHNKITDEQ